MSHRSTARSRVRPLLLAIPLCLAAFSPVASGQSRDHSHGEGSRCSPIGKPAPLTPGDSQLASEWVRSVSRERIGRFLVVSDLAPDRTRALAEQANRMHDAYRSALGSFRDRERVSLELWLFSGAADQQRVIAREFDADVTGMPGVALVDGSRVALVASAELAAAGRPDPGDARLARVLRHEGFHQAQATLFPEMPVWAAEGMAELFADGVVVGSGRDASLLLGGVPSARLERLRRRSADRSLAPLDAFVRVDGDEDHEDDDEAEYERWDPGAGAPYADARHDQAWGFVHLLAFGRDGAHRGAFDTFLGALNRGASASTAWNRAFGGASPRGLESSMVGHLDRVPAFDLQVTLDRLAFLAEGLASLWTGGVPDAPPTDLTALQAALVASDFALPGAGGLSASDEAVFTVPAAGARFSLVDCPRPASLPPCIAVEGPLPREIGVAWSPGRRGSAPVWRFVWR